ncbi:DNA primase [Mycoplasma haemocanis str. Illinois]|uniref:DNA primase n=1 Tax=Mycoplasma haemocanis (strain Illinois) TaxID=1111676 RepID=H6N6X3_MYCHN|nr:DNA primase [Mycoplasma haemocanis]AEW45395.1 DNA primase [Mycoplasma haemocanis str. Illinois]
MDIKSPSSFSILKVIQNYIKTSQRGANYWSVCPFHQDKSPSLSISPEKNIFKCFSCGVSGDAVAFVMKIEKCNYVQSIYKISEILGLDPNQYLTAKESSNNKLFKINEVVALAYHKFLFNKVNKHHLEYLTNERGLSKEIIQKYQLGYAPEEDILKDVFRSYLSANEKESFGDEEYEKLGIFNYGRGTPDPFFKDRIIFPIFNRHGQIVGFSGRAIKNVEPKYLNTKSNIIFNKKNCIYNIQNLQEGSPVYLYEGFFDVLSSEKVGIKNGVAVMGASLDSSILDVIKNYSKKIVCCFDNDNTGRNFTIKVFENLVLNGFSIYVLDLLDTKSKDIDEYLRKSESDSWKRLKEPSHFFEWYRKLYIQEKDISNPLVLQPLIEESLGFLFVSNASSPIMKGGVDREYALDSLKIIFDFYKLSSDFSNEKHSSIINKKYQSYKHAVTASLIRTLPTRHIPKQIRSIDKFQSLLTKYSKIFKYIENNGESLGDANEWFFEIPEEYVSVSREAKLFFSLLSKRLFGGDSSQEEIDNLANLIQEKDKDIPSIEEFFNCYFSLNEGIMEEIRNMWKKNELLDVTERWIKTEALKKLILDNKQKSSAFFRKFCLSKKNRN